MPNPLVPTIYQNPGKRSGSRGLASRLIGLRPAQTSLKEYGVVKFRKTIDLTSKPASFVVHVSGDNRYKLFVNEKQVAQAPTRGDLYFWNYETIDLAPYLRAGRNLVAAVVWNDGCQKPEAQISFLTGFILQGNTPAEEILYTNEGWKTAKDESYQLLPVRVPGYCLAGPRSFKKIRADSSLIDLYNSSGRIN